YVDIDIVNAIFAIFVAEASKASKECDALDRYLLYRNDMLSEKKATKKDVISMMLTSDIIPQDTCFREMHRFLFKTLVPILKKKRIEIWDDLRQENPKTNFKGKFLARCAFATECEILMN